MKALIVALTMIAAPVWAQDLVFSMTDTEECFASEGTFDECVGASAARCIEETEGGYSTVGMGACYDAERAAWDAELNRVYGEAMAVAEEMDSENGPNAYQAEALRAMQRAWIPYRDATCDYVRSQYGGGTGGGPAAMVCLMTETARQALYLQAQIEEGN
ncbi:lysozyme inhibitor LprI family protein [Tropicibacter sp. S64]|uniref:lysozyme inhibitor LprI family protein n=1 Tax=Tropicibacter sp. S64 TaxID=3415122 RepID=UPI003C7A1B29